MYQENEIATLADDLPQEAISGADARLVARGRAMMELIGATEFSLLLLLPGVESRLAPIFDSSDPEMSLLSRELSSATGERFVRLLMSGVTPAWWSAGEELNPWSSGQSAWTRRLPVEDAGEGVGFPLYSECGKRGALIFAGGTPDIQRLDLCDLHCRAMELFFEFAAQRTVLPPRAPAMSRRELECLRLTANGMTSDAIAATLGLSVHTANQYLSNCTQKLNAVSRIHAVAKALRFGLID